MNFVLERIHFHNKIVLDKPQKPYTCGRGKENEIVCLSLLVSRRHCIFFYTKDHKLFVTDLQSANGIYINGKIQIPYQIVPLTHNDIIGIGCKETNPTSTDFVAFKVSIIKASFSEEAMSINALSDTILNRDNTQQEPSVSYEKCAQQERQGANLTGCDIAVPCTEPKQIIKSNTNISREMNSNISEYDNKNNSTDSAEVKFDTIDVKNEDNEIIHTPITEKTNQNAKHSNHKSSKNNNKLNLNDNTDRSSEIPCWSIDKDNSANKNNTTKETSNLNKANDLHATKKQNLVHNTDHNNDQIMKMPEDELQLTDDDEEVHLSAANRNTACNTPMKLKKIKQEPNTRFSEIDVVDLSDDENEVFPCSQLFDIKFEDNTENKQMDVKQEYIGNDSEKTGLLDVDDDGVIVLTDSEDEDNPWLHRLSRSQLISEIVEPTASDVTVKEEIDYGIWDEDLLNIMQDIPSTSKDVDMVITKPVDNVSGVTSANEGASLELYVSANNTTSREVNSSSNLLTTRADTMDVDDICLSKDLISKKNVDHTSEQKVDVRQSKESEQVTKSKKLKQKQAETSNNLKQRQREPSKLETSNELEQIETSKKFKQTEMFNKLEETKTLNKLKQTTSNELEEMEISNKPEQIETSNKLKQAVTSNKLEKMETPNKIKQTVTSNELEKMETFNKPEQIETSNNFDQTETSHNVSPRTCNKSRPYLTKSTKRVIQVIEAPHLPVKRNRTNKDYNTASTSVEDKSPPKLTTLEKKIKLKEKIDDKSNQDKEQNQRKKTSKETENCVQLSKMDKTSMSKEKKRMIMEERKMKLKKIAEEKNKLSSNQTVIHRTAKPRAKITQRNRGHFLIDNQEEICESRKSKSNVSANTFESMSVKQTESTNLQSDLSAIGLIDIDMLKDSTNSNETINNVATSLQQSLHLNTDKISKRDSTKDSKMTNYTRKKRSNFERSKNNKIATDVDIKIKYELKENTSECVPAPVQASTSSDTKKSILIMMGSKVKKNVSFCENVQTLEYEIEPHNSLKKLVGKDAPIPNDKLAKRSCTKKRPKFEEFLWRIFMWNPVWLVEQRYLRSEPPVVSENQIQPMRLRYDSYEQYYKIAQPLLLLEIWHSITKDFEMIENNKQHETIVCSIVPNSFMRVPISSTNLFLTTLMFEVLVNKENFSKHSYPRFGDLVLFEYASQKKNRQTPFHKVFAYVINVHHVVITEYTQYNRELRKYVPNPYAVITYSVQTRSLEHDIPASRIQRIRTITYLRSNMRLVQALQYLPQSPLCDLILNPKVEDYQLPPFDPSSESRLSVFTKDKLNSKQLQAVFQVTETVLREEAKLCFIQGPPGTGKSKVIVNLVTQILYGDSKYRTTEKRHKILICAPSNTAIDEIVLRLLAIRSNLKQRRFRLVRIGRLETMHPTVKDISVTEFGKRFLKKLGDTAVYRSLASNGAALVQEEKIKMDAILQELQTTKNMLDVKRKDLKRRLNEAKMRYMIMTHGKPIDQLRNLTEFPEYERTAEETILAGADIIACTLSSCYTNQMESVFGINKQQFSVCIVDEATQSCEAETLIPLMLGVKTLVLVGDPNQLPATILSQQAKRLGLDQSVFSRIQKVFAAQTNNPIIMLDTQYRMAYHISYWPNNYFYGKKLKNAVDIRVSFPFHAYRVLNHKFVQNDDKFSNTTEAEFVANMIFTMLKFAKWEDANGCISLGVLTPYNNQRNMISNKIKEKISSIPDNMKKRINYEVNTVDGFQGQERDIIIMSCVRSHGIGFLSDRQRLCVALTRAKHSLILCGNFQTFMRDPMWKALLFDARSRGILCDIEANATPTVIKPFVVK